MKGIFPSHEELDRQAEEGRKAIEAERAKGPDKNSALIWFPAIRDAGLPVPRTEFVEFNPDSLWSVCDCKPPLDDFPMDELKAVCERIGYPVFIRTDLSSAKHDGPRSFRAESEKDLWQCVCSTFEDNACKDLASFVRVWMVRDWLDLTQPESFTAFGGLTIGREWRFFADQERVLCRHFYWPQEAFRDGYGLTEGWEQRLSILSEPLRFDEEHLLSVWAIRATRAIGHDSWSVDFAFDANGKPWLIDMARAESSWHPKHEESA